MGSNPLILQKPLYLFIDIIHRTITPIFIRILGVKLQKSRRIFSLLTGLDTKDHNSEKILRENEFFLVFFIQKFLY